MKKLLATCTLDAFMIERVTLETGSRATLLSYLSHRMLSPEHDASTETMRRLALEDFDSAESDDLLRVLERMNVHVH